MNRFCQFTGVALLLTCSLFTGCVTSPYDGEVVGDSISDSFKVKGWVQQPNKLIRIQVRRTSNEPWVQIASTYSGTIPVEFDGQTFYHWERSLVVPAAHWLELQTYSNPPIPLGSRTYVRAVMGNTVLSTFDTNIETIILNDPSTTIEELVENHAAGNSVSVWVKP